MNEQDDQQLEQKARRRSRAPHGYHVVHNRGALTDDCATRGCNSRLDGRLLTTERLLFIFYISIRTGGLEEDLQSNDR